MAKETVYKIRITLESNDEADLSRFVHYIAEDIEDGRLIARQTAGMNNVDGVVTYEKEKRCEYCHDTGEVATDESDGEGNIMRGVGTAKCECQHE